ncbi:MAG: hypothetical protein MN733_39540, partial [Nitrososphaera sp.]|nr:hypothetical protein [Nitrososphaera sp.]
MIRLFFCLFLTSILVSDVWAETPPPDEVSKPFTVYYSLWNRVEGHPDFEAAGLVDVPFIGESNIFNLNCADDDAVSTEECLDSYNENMLRSGLQKIATEKGTNFSGLIHVDIESIPLDSETKFDDNSWLYYTVAEVLREELPNAKLAWYGSVGPFGHAGLVHKGNQAHIEAAMAKDDFSEPIYLLADATNPQVYTAEDDQEQWKSITEFRINEMRRLAPGKPIYPVIKVLYNIGELGFDPIPYEFIKFKLETLLELGADGVIIWEGAIREWDAKDENTEFWPALLDFMAENDLSGSSSNTAPTISDITS